MASIGPPSIFVAKCDSVNGLQNRAALRPAASSARAPPVASRLLISREPARTKAGACGWAVNAIPFKERRFKQRNRRKPSGEYLFLRALTGQLALLR